MANIKIDDVRAAVQELRDAGLAVTGANVRGRLGRGSSTTITRLLKEVREAATPSTPNALAHEFVPPSEVIERISNAAISAAKEAYKAIAEALKRDIDAANARINKERIAMQSDLDQVLADAGEARETADKLQSELAAALREHSVAQTQLVALRTELEHRERAEEAERKRASEELDRLRQQLAASHEHSRSLQDRLERELSEAGALRGKLSTIGAQRPDKGR